jgi:sec-independent protein translocase protein TatA
MFESPWHWAVVVVIGFILFFGWKQLPDMARSVGRSLRIFKTEMKGMTQDEKQRAEAEPPRELPPAEIVRNDAAAKPRPRPNPARTDSGPKAD